MSERYRRRQLLGVVGTGVTLSAAGCIGGDDENGDGQEDGGDDGADDETENGPADEDEPPRSDADTLPSITETLDGDVPLWDPDSKTFSGSGEDETDQFELVEGPAVIAWEFEDAETGDHFVDLVRGGEQELRLLAAFEPIDGASTNLRETRNDYHISVTAPGEWTVHVGQPSAPDEEIRLPPVTASGDGQDVVGPVEIREPVPVVANYDGESRFRIDSMDENQTSLSVPRDESINEMGSFDGARGEIETEGIVWLDIVADGEWSIEIGE